MLGGMRPSGKPVVPDSLRAGAAWRGIGPRILVVSAQGPTTIS